MNVYTWRLFCPNIRSQADAADIKASLAGSPGIGEVTVDVLNHTIVATTASQDGGREMMIHLAKASFPVEISELIEVADRPG